ncbi:MAG: endonuclease [Bacillales bacterium]|jgi:endonuclease I|nr:endonuclease [Bacillales bacterium]
MKKASLLLISLLLVGCTLDYSSTIEQYSLVESSESETEVEISSVSSVSSSTVSSSSKTSSSSSSSTTSSSSFIETSTPTLTGYYASANGKTGQALKTALKDIIKNMDSVSYGSLYGSSGWMSKADKKANGNVWDVYSDVPNGTPPYEYSFSNTCGNYSKEGDCWNREHMIPQSVFSEKSPMVSDIFHLYPTDGKVNGMRSNFPFGEVNSATFTSLNGSKLGSAITTFGYSGTVFEPIDAYKGDIARVYFYFVTRYQEVMPTFKDYAMFVKTDIGLSTWAQKLLLKWHLQDPVSPKEIARNNYIYDNIQENRNPFVDYPALATLIWSA